MRRLVCIRLHFRQGEEKFMRYYVINDGQEINRFKKYRVVDLETCNLLQVGGNDILRNKETYTTDSEIFKDFEFKSRSTQVRVTKRGVMIYYQGMSYVLSCVKIRYIYITDEKAYVGIEGVDDECIIDFHADKFRNIGTAKCTMCEQNLFENKLPIKIQKALAVG